MIRSIVTSLTLIFILTAALAIGCASPTPSSPVTVPAVKPSETAPAETAAEKPAIAPAPATYPNSGLLVSAKWLSEHNGDPGLVIIDARRNFDYDAGHIQNAINSYPSLFDQPSANTDEGDLLGANEVASKLGRLGVSDKAKVIIYSGGVDGLAGRLFWMLEYLGHTDVHILEGGLVKYKRDGYGGIVTEKFSREPTTFIASVNQARLATKSYVLANYLNRSFALVDARRPGDYNTGRIPGAINIPPEEYLISDSMVKSFSDLRTLLDSKGINRDNPIITYCLLGYASAQAYFIYRLMGLDAALYDGSWDEWRADPSLPTEP